MNAGPSCPIRFTQRDQAQSLVDLCLTAAEVEWRRWSEWQMERSATKRLKLQRRWIGAWFAFGEHQRLNKYPHKSKNRGANIKSNQKYKSKHFKKKWHNLLIFFFIYLKTTFSLLFVRSKRDKYKNCSSFFTQQFLFKKSRKFY